ncbi:MAG: hypothetical protein PW788_02190 [Micavibrio sp.]|nr:hypothetical protein [Micavibrio sp.]
MAPAKRGFAQTLKRGCITLAAAFTLVAGGTPSRAQDAPPQPSPPTVQVMPPAKAIPLKAAKAAAPVDSAYATSKERLQVIEGSMRKTPLGRALLQFAADENIRIVMSDSKVMDPNPNDNLMFKGRNYSTRILLNGDVKSHDEIMITLAHEIRHSWHERQLHTNRMKLDPQREWVKRRIQEADCFAFEIHFAYEYEKATGKTLNLGSRKNCDNRGGYACLLQNYSNDRAAMPVGDAYSKLLGRTFKHVHAQGYDRSFVDDLDNGWGYVVDYPGLGILFNERLLNPTPDAEYARNMRRVATAGLTPGVDPAALADWTNADFSSLDKTGAVDADVKADFDKVQSRYAAARFAWVSLLDFAATQKFPDMMLPPKPPAPLPPTGLPEAALPVRPVIPEPKPPKRGKA